MVHEGFKFPIEHFPGTACFVFRTVILNELVRVKDVASDLAPPLDLSLFGGKLLQFFFPLALVVIVKAGAKDLHGGGAILMLGSLVLAGDHNAGRDMGNPHCGVGRVHVLTSVTARTKGFDAEVLFVYLDFNLILDLRQNGNSCKACVPSSVRIEGTDPDKAVDPRLALEIPVCPGTLDAKGGAFDPCAFAGVLIHEDHRKPLPLRIAGDHPEEHLRPILSFGPACPRLDGYDGIPSVVLLPQEELDLEPLKLFCCLGEKGFQFTEGFALPLFEEFDQGGKIPFDLFQFLKAPEGFAGLLELPKELLSLLWVVPEVGSGDLAFELRDLPFETGGVKDTP